MIARLLVDGVGLAGEQRLVDLERGGRAHDAVGGDLVTGAELDEIVEDDVVHGDLAHVAVAHDAHAWLAEHCKLVEGSLGPQLLDDADERVADQHDAEQRVLRMPHGQDHHEQHAQDGVEAREDVRPEDLAERATRALAGGVRLAPVDALPDLGFGETGRRGLVHPLGRNGLARTRRCCHIACLARVGSRDELDLARVVVLEHPVAGELGQAIPALVGPGRDELVVRLEAHMTARAVDVAAGATDGEDVQTRLELDLGLAECAPVEL